MDLSEITPLPDMAEGSVPRATARISLNPCPRIKSFQREMKENHSMARTE